MPFGDWPELLSNGRIGLLDDESLNFGASLGENPYIWRLPLLLQQSKLPLDSIRSLSLGMDRVPVDLSVTSVRISEPGDAIWTMREMLISMADLHQTLIRTALTRLNLQAIEAHQ